MHSTQTPDTVATVLRVCNSTASSVRVLWLDHQGQEHEYQLLEPWCSFNQTTFSTHPWRFREKETGRVLGEYVGPTATVRLAEDGASAIRLGLHYDMEDDLAPPHPVWGRYCKRGEAHGIPVKAFDCVSPEAVALAVHALECMMADLDAGVIQLMRERGAELAIIGRHQETTDIPPHRQLSGKNCGASRKYDSCRGLGGNISIPTASVGEENIVMVGDDAYFEESVLVHEWAHTVMDIGLHEHPLRDAIVKAHAQAKARGIYDPSSYLISNPCEYWAEATQAWFEATIRTDVTSGMTTREHVKARDPELAYLLIHVFGDGAWRYPYTAPRPFGRQHQTGGASSVPIPPLLPVPAPAWHAAVTAPPPLPVLPQPEWQRLCPPVHLIQGSGTVIQQPVLGSGAAWGWGGAAGGVGGREGGGGQPHYGVVNGGRTEEAQEQPGEAGGQRRPKSKLLASLWPWKRRGSNS